MESRRLRGGAGGSCWVNRGPSEASSRAAPWPASVAYFLTAAYKYQGKAIVPEQQRGLDGPHTFTRPSLRVKTLADPPWRGPQVCPWRNGRFARSGAGDRGRYRDMEGTYGGTPDAACLRHLTRGKPGLAIKHGNVGRTNTHAETTLIGGEGVRVKGPLDGCDTLIVRGLVETSFKARSLQVLESGGSARTSLAIDASIPLSSSCGSFYRSPMSHQTLTHPNLLCHRSKGRRPV